MCNFLSVVQGFLIIVENDIESITSSFENLGQQALIEHLGIEQHENGMWLKNEAFRISFL